MPAPSRPQGYVYRCLSGCPHTVNFRTLALWSGHEQDFHNRNWPCSGLNGSCKKTFNSYHDYRRHVIQKGHRFEGDMIEMLVWPGSGKGEPVMAGTFLGRDSGVKVEKKENGIVEERVGDVSAQIPVKRGRGRPRKVARPVDVEDEGEDTESSGADEGEIVAQAPTRKRRDRTVKARKRVIVDDEDDNVEEDLDKDDTAPQDAPVKRGRGRPRKIQKVETVNKEDAKEVKAPKKRGRKPRVKVEPATISEDLITSPVNNTGVNDTAPEIPISTAKSLSAESVQFTGSTVVSQGHIAPVTFDVDSILQAVETEEETKKRLYHESIKTTGSETIQSSMTTALPTYLPSGTTGKLEVGGSSENTHLSGFGSTPLPWTVAPTKLESHPANRGGLLTPPASTKPDIPSASDSGINAVSGSKLSSKSASKSSLESSSNSSARSSKDPLNPPISARATEVAPIASTNIILGSESRSSNGNITPPTPSTPTAPIAPMFGAASALPTTAQPHPPHQTHHHQYPQYPQQSHKNQQEHQAMSFIPGSQVFSVQDLVRAKAYVQNGTTPPPSYFSLFGGANAFLGQPGEQGFIAQEAMRRPSMQGGVNGQFAVVNPGPGPEPYISNMPSSPPFPLSRPGPNSNNYSSNYNHSPANPAPYTAQMQALRSTQAPAVYETKPHPQPAPSVNIMKIKRELDKEAETKDRNRIREELEYEELEIEALKAELKLKEVRHQIKRRKFEASG